MSEPAQQATHPRPKRDVELKADPKQIREALKREREKRGVKISQSKLP